MFKDGERAHLELKLANLLGLDRHRSLPLVDADATEFKTLHRVPEPNGFVVAGDENANLRTLRDQRDSAGKKGGKGKSLCPPPPA